MTKSPFKSILLFLAPRPAHLPLNPSLHGSSRLSPPSLFLPSCPCQYLASSIFDPPNTLHDPTAPGSVALSSQPLHSKALFPLHMHPLYSVSEPSLWIKSCPLAPIPTFWSLINSFRTASGLLSSKSYFSTTGEAASDKTKCWACGELKYKRNLICLSCNAVQSPDSSIDYFEMFEVDRKYELDLKDLESKYKNLMKKLHPDLLYKKSEEEQVNAGTTSAVVTRAYYELMKPVSRATYLLQLQGIHVEEEGTVTDPELLMEVMEMRETLEGTSDDKALQQLYNKAKEKVEEWENSFTAAFKEGSSAAAVAALQRMSYFYRLFEEIKRKLL